MTMFADGLMCDTDYLDQHIEKLRSDLKQFIEFGDDVVFDTDSADRNNNEVYIVFIIYQASGYKDLIEIIIK